MKIYMDEQLPQYRLFCNPDVVVQHGLADVTASQLSHSL